MKVILFFIIGIFAVSLGLMFLPLLIGGFMAYFYFQEGNIIASLFSIIVALLIQWGFFALLNNGDGFGGGGSCPSCGGGDTDGNHCYTCDDDF